MIYEGTGNQWQSSFKRLYRPSFKRGGSNFAIGRRGNCVAAAKKSEGIPAQEYGVFTSFHTER